MTIPTHNLFLFFSISIFIPSGINFHLLLASQICSILFLLKWQMLFFEVIERKYSKTRCSMKHLNSPLLKALMTMSSFSYFAKLIYYMCLTPNLLETGREVPNYFFFSIQAFKISASMLYSGLIITHWSNLKICCVYFGSWIIKVYLPLDKEWIALGWFYPVFW